MKCITWSTKFGEYYLQMGPAPCFLSTTIPEYYTWESNLDPWNIRLSRNYYDAAMVVVVVTIAAINCSGSNHSDSSSG